MATNKTSAIEREPIGDIEVAYRAAGAGRPIVFIHGLAQDHAMWIKPQADLQDYATHAYDVRGHGRTTLGSADGTLAQLGDDLIGFLERIDPATCVGFSLGGTVALWAASERPELVRDVVAIATSSVVGRAAAGFFAERIGLFEGDDEPAVREALLSDTRAQLANPDVDVEAVTEARIEAIGDRRGYVNGARAMAAIHDQPLNDRLTKISAPVLAVTGEHDRFCPRRAAEIMLEHLPDGQFQELPGVGHLATDDDPDAVTEVLRNWLERDGEA